MSKLVEIRWYLAEDGSGHVTKLVHEGKGVTERVYAFDSLSREDQIPPHLASLIRQDGRTEASLSYEAS